MRQEARYRRRKRGIIMPRQQKLHRLLEVLQIKNADLARETGLDAASISRYKLGKRPLSSRHILLLSQAIARLAPTELDEGRWPEDLSLPAGDDEGEAGLAQAIRLWLSDGIDAEAPEKRTRAPRRHKREQRLKIFGEKLSLLMDTAELSGAQIANALHVDPSLIYKYRLGTRSPSPQSDTIERIAAYVCSQARTPEQRRRIAEAAGIEAGGRTIAAEELQQWLVPWLKEPQEEDTSTIATFLKRVDDVDFFASQAGLIPLERIAPLVGDPQLNQSFWGIQGMRDSAARFLYRAATLAEATTICIYTSSSLDFLTADSQWQAVWASLMVHCLLKGHRIRIIHNMANRSVAEIMEAIAAFVPLYMIGRMEPYTFRKPESTLLRHTLYLVEGQVAVTADYAAGMDDSGEYIYSDEPRRLASLQQHFEVLLANCNDLMQIYRGVGEREAYAIRLSRFWQMSGDATLLLPSLSLATLPETLLSGMLNRADLPEASRHQILGFYANERRALERQLERANLDELSVIASEQGLAAEDVVLDIPHHLLPQPIVYRPHEYSAHLQRIRELERQQSNYRFLTLPAAPFRNIKVFHRKAEVIVQKAGNPAAAFVIDNIHMCHGFEHFLNELKQKAVP